MALWGSYGPRPGGVIGTGVSLFSDGVDQYNCTLQEIADLKVETDPVFDAWLSATPPAYPGDIPSALSELSDDSTHRLVTDTEKNTWNNKLSAESDPVFGTWLSTTPPAFPGDIPTALSELSDDSTHRLVTDTEKGTWNGKQDALVSGTNIKTINTNTILGSGDLDLSFYSAGTFVIPTITDNNNGTVTLGNNGEFCFHKIADGSGPVFKYSINGGLFSLTDTTQNYIVANYNSGIPVISVITDVTLINETTIVPVYSIYRTGTELHIQPWDNLGKALVNKLHQSIVKTQRYRRQSGLIISEYGTRNIKITEGITWIGAVPVTTPEINSDIDNIWFLYHSGGTWTYSMVTQYNNSQYDNGTDLVSLTSNRYTVNWVFRGIETQNHTYVVVGTGDYTLTQAQAATVPSLPGVISSHAILVGKIIVQEGASIATSIQSAFDFQFSLSGSIDHNDTANKQGGDGSNYYHSDQPINTTDDVTFNTVNSTALNSTELQRGTDSKMGTGIPDAEKKKFKLVSSYNSGTNQVTLSLAFVGAYTSFNYYINNKKFTVTAGNISAYTQTATVASGTWFFYVNQSTTDVASPVMILTQSAWGISDPDVLLWNGSWDNVNKEWLWIGHEKHTYGRDLFNHARNHAQGAVYSSGFLFSQYNGLTNLSGNTDDNFGRAMTQISGGYFFDEDLKNGIAHSDTALSATMDNPETDWDKFVYQFLGFSALATVGTTSTSIVFGSSRTLVAGQAVTVMQGNTTTVRGTTTITTGGTGTTFAVTSVTGLTSGDMIVLGGRIPIYYIHSVSGGNYTWRKLSATSFLGVTTAAATWTRSTTTATVTFNNHGMQTGDKISVTISSSVAAIPLKDYTITRTGINTFTITCLDAGDASGSMTYYNAYNSTTISSGVAQYNNVISGLFTTQTANRYYPIWIAETNFIHEPVIAILGQGQSTNNNLTTALSEAPFQFSNLVGLSGLGIQEIVPTYRLIFHYNTAAGFTNSKIRLVSATWLDVRVATVSGTVVSGGGASDHALLSNRDWLSANHTASTIDTVAGFDSTGAPQLLPISYSGNNFGIGSNTTGKNVNINATLGTPETMPLTTPNWTLGTGWSYGTSPDRIEKIIDGTGTVTPAGATSIVAGTTYKVVLDVTITAGTLAMAIGGQTGSSMTTTGVYTEYITANNTTKLTFSASSTDLRCVINSITWTPLVDATGDLSVEGNLFANVIKHQGGTDSIYISRIGNVGIKTSPLSGNNVLVVGGSTTINGSLTLTASAFTANQSSTINVPNTTTTQIIGLDIVALTAASGTTTERSSPIQSFRSRAWNGSASVFNAMCTRVRGVPAATTSGRYVWENVIVNGGADTTELGCILTNGNWGIKGVTTPTASLHLGAGTATAGTAPLKLTSGTLLTSAEAGAIEFTTDDLYFTITTGAARKGIVLNNGSNLTSGKYPIATTNGRLTDGPTPLAGTKVYYVSDSSGGTVNRKLTFTDGILTSET